jgi:hypothetical protein
VFLENNSPMFKDLFGKISWFKEDGNKIYYETNNIRDAINNFLNVKNYKLLENN